MAGDDVSRIEVGFYIGPTSSACSSEQTTMSTNISAEQSKELYTRLLTLPAPLYHQPSPIPATGLEPALSADAAALLLHPALEAAYHLLNHALYPAHFLVRKMQNDRAGQHLHGILHRVEGDYDNARVWYREACGAGERTTPETRLEGEEGCVAFWGRVAELEGRDAFAEGRKEQAVDAAMAFLDRVQVLKETSKGQIQDAGAGTDERAALERISRAELQAVVEWVTRTYGWGTWNGGDGSEAYTESTEEQKKEMVEQQSGGEGFRSF